MSNHHNISFLHGKRWRAMNWNVSVSFLITIIFWHVVQVISPHHNRPLHLGGNDNTLQDFASNRDVTCEGTFLVNIFGFDSFLGGLESQSDILEVPDTGCGLLSEQLFAIEEHIFLFLEGSLMLRLEKSVLGCQPFVDRYN